MEQTTKLSMGKFMDANSILNFGKHKGKKLSEVIFSSPGYVAWLMEKDIITIPEELVKRVKQGIREEAAIKQKYRNRRWGREDSAEESGIEESDFGDR